MGSPGYCETSIRVRRAQSGLWPVLSVLQWRHRLSGAGRACFSASPARKRSTPIWAISAARPIKLAWFSIVFPSLILNYAGQAALVLEGAPTDGNIFFRLCPEMLLIPLIVLATVATIIASQSIITGAFSMTRQAIQLGWLPRLRIKQTSSEGYGQIYVGVVNWLLMIVTIGLTIGFGKSDNLASAYGIAVSLTMLMTSALLFIAMREIWGWSLLAAGASRLLPDGRWRLLPRQSYQDRRGRICPLILAIAVYGVMWIWHRGAAAVSLRMHEASDPGPNSWRISPLITCRASRHRGVPDPYRTGHAAGDDLARQA